MYLLDGTLMNDFTNGPAGSAASTSLGTETVREFRVETNAYSAEFGRNSGGQINVITKSGQNDWHGSLYEYHRNDALDARNFFDPAEKPDFRRNQFGATLCGPAARRTRPSSSSATRACASGSARRSRRSCPTRPRASGPAGPGRRHDHACP